VKTPNPEDMTVGSLASEDKYFYNEEHGLPVIMHLFDGHIGKDVLEIGSGTGAIAEWLAQSGCHVTAVEPEPILAKRVRERLRGNTGITVIESDSAFAFDKLMKDKQKFDTVIYVSVLEHISDDLREFELAKSVLNDGGKLLIFVPALPALYSPIDAHSGHVRRYTKSRFKELSRSVGMEIVSLNYFETVGILPYLIVYKLLRRRAITNSSTGFYNNVILPASLAIYRLTRGRLIGKNLVLIARKAS
jgi:SAM-dependent methyltransferase